MQTTQIFQSFTTRPTLVGFYHFTRDERENCQFSFGEDFCTLFKHLLSFVYWFWYIEKVSFRFYIYVMFLVGVAIMRLVCILGACDVITRILQPEIFYSHTDWSLKLRGHCHKTLYVLVIANCKLKCHVEVKFHYWFCVS